MEWNIISFDFQRNELISILWNDMKIQGAEPSDDREAAGKTVKITSDAFSLGSYSVAAPQL